MAEGNILNLNVVVPEDNGGYVVAASWIEETHDKPILELLASKDVTVAAGKRYSTNGRSGSIHFTGDGMGRIFVCITKGSTYPPRVAHTCLEELQDHVVLSKVNQATLKARETGQFNDAFVDFFDSLVDRYDDPSQVDAMTSVSRKIEVTTSLMQDNISLLLENDAKIKDLDVKAEKVNDQAEKFQENSTELKKKMWWRLCKIRLCYALVVSVILLVIILAIVLTHPAPSPQQVGDGSEDIVVHNHYYRSDGSDGVHDDEYWMATHADEGRQSQQKL